MLYILPVESGKLLHYRIVLGASKQKKAVPFLIGWHSGVKPLSKLSPGFQLHVSEWEVHAPCLGFYL